MDHQCHASPLLKLGKRVMFENYLKLAKLPGVARVDLWFDAPKVEHLQSLILTNVVCIVLSANGCTYRGSDNPAPLHSQWTTPFAMLLTCVHLYYRQFGLFVVEQCCIFAVSYLCSVLVYSFPCLLSFISSPCYHLYPIHRLHHCHNCFPCHELRS